MSCHCYCGIDLPAPCGDEACKRACGWNGGGGAVSGGGFNLQQQMAITGASAIGNALGNAIGNALRGDPAADAARREAARRQAEWEAEQRRLAEEARRKKFEADRKELLQGLKNPSGEELRLKDMSAGNNGVDFERRVLEDRARREALARMKGKPDEDWCKLHLIGLKRPTRPLSDVGSQFASMVARYRGNVREWDSRCGGPSAQPGYADEDFGEGSASNASAGGELQLKPMQAAAPAPESGIAAAQAPAEDAPLQMKDLSAPPEPALLSKPLPAAEQKNPEPPPAARQDPAAAEPPSTQAQSAPAPESASEPAAQSIEDDKDSARAEFEQRRNLPAGPKPPTAPAPTQTAAGTAEKASQPSAPPGAKAPGHAPPRKPTPAAADSAAVAAVKTSSRGDSSAPAPRSGLSRRQEKALDCAVSEVYGQAEGMGEEGRGLARQLRQDLRAILADLRAQPPSGTQDAHKIFSSGRDYIAKDKERQEQLIVKVLVQRDEKTGELHIDVQSSALRGAHPEQTAQNLIYLDAKGTVIRKEVSPAAEACLSR
ncbi:MAG: hypothetical protein WCU88_00035 [Elusimicrobiota bacterium]